MQSGFNQKRVCRIAREILAYRNKLYAKKNSKFTKSRLYKYYIEYIMINMTLRIFHMNHWNIQRSNDFILFVINHRIQLL